MYVAKEMFDGRLERSSRNSQISSEDIELDPEYDSRPGSQPEVELDSDCYLF